MDVDINEESLENANNKLNIAYDNLKKLQKTVADAESYVSSIGENVNFNGNSESLKNSSVEIENLSKSIKDTKKFLGLTVTRQLQSTSAAAKTFYDSFYGVQNTPTYEYFKKLFSGVTKTGANSANDKVKDAIDKKREGKSDIAKTWKDKLEKYFRDRFTGASKADKWRESKENDIKAKIGDAYNADYTYGKNYKWDAVDFWSKDLWKASGEIYKIEGSQSGDYGDLEGSIRFGSYDTSGSIRVGPDHVVLDASATISGVTAKGSYNTPALSADGLEIISAGASGEVSLLYAQAKAKAGFGKWKDKDGKVHREAGVQLKAEADLAHAEAKGHVTVAGVTAEGTIGVKIGVGAKFDVGFVDGKLNVNVGLAAGIGFDVGFSLDFSKVSDYVGEKVTKFGRGVLNFFGFKV